ncbi:MAG: hypothetical protein U0Q18_02890 [Bryobacteraceae bacterium]
MKSFLGSICLAQLVLQSAFPGVFPMVRGISAGGEVAISYEGQKLSLHKGEAAGPWTLMAVARAGQRRVAIFEDFTQQKSRIVIADSAGNLADLPKSLEPSFASVKGLYRGHSLSEVMSSDEDLLGKEILAGGGDPQYKDVEACFPPIAKMRTYTFVGVRENFDKVGFAYGGRTSHFDPAVYVPAIDGIRDRREVLDGLVGGWLPVVRFVYPEASGAWTELVAFAPFRMVNGNHWIQPVWYRVARVEGDRLQWARYFDSYHPFPPRGDQPAEAFYEDLLAMRAGWSRILDTGMKLDLPDARVMDMARHSVVRDIITRLGVEPKYGVFDKNYGGNEHDGFPDTFNADTISMNEWGQLGLAGQYIDNYFGKFVRDDGSILYRGPETGQYGRMLTTVAQFANYGGDTGILLRNRRHIDAVAKLLLSMRRKALQRPRDDAAYGMIAGWSEADSCLDPDPQRYMQPYFSNSTEAARGFHDLGEVWVRIGKSTSQQELTSWGEELLKQAKSLESDIQNAIARSMVRDLQPAWLPSIAGAKEPFHVAVARDRLDPQWRSYRAYMEMLFSGDLTREQVETVVRYRAAHRDTILGVPTAYGWNTNEMTGFLTYGHSFGLLQHDFVPEYLLTLYSIMAHQYTRGTWTAPETRNIDPEHEAAPYCTPAQMVVPMMTRWMLIFEDPQSATVWLAKGTPRDWLADQKKISVSAAPTKYGKLGYSVTSQIGSGKVNAVLDLPATGYAAALKLRLRAPQGSRIQSVVVNGKTWKDFDAEREIVNLPAKLASRVTISVAYR